MMWYRPEDENCRTRKFFREYCNLDLKHDWYYVDEHGYFYYMNECIEMKMVYLDQFYAWSPEITWRTDVLKVIGKMIFEENFTFYIP